MRRVKLWNREENEINLKIQGELLIIRVLSEKCDTCDSKKDKTPVMRAYARMCREEIVGILHFVTK